MTINTPPYGNKARYWTWLEETVTIAVANQAQKLWPRGAGRPVEQVSVQAAVTNSDSVTLGSGRVAINTGIRQLLPGQVFTISLAEDEPIQTGTINDSPAVLVKPVELINADQLFAISPTVAQVLLVSLWFRQPGQ